jgi:hypothetical protein
MMMNGRLAFRRALQGKNEGNPPFVPFIYGLAARTANVSLRDMVTDPGCYTNALEGVFRLLGYEVITTSYDTTIESEPWGSQIEWRGDYLAPVLVRAGNLLSVRPEDFLKGGRIPVVMEVTKRLVISAGRSAAIACVVGGPCSIVKGLQGSSGLTEPGSTSEAVKLLGGFLSKLVRSLCELKVDAVFFREDPLGEELVGELNLNKEAYIGLYATLFNIVRAFNGFPVLLTKHLTMDAVKDVHGLVRPDAISLLGTAFDDTELPALLELADNLRVSFGVPLPIGTDTPEALWDRLRGIESFVARCRPRRFFYTSDGEIPHDTPMEVLHVLMDRLRAGTTP